MCRIQYPQVFGLPKSLLQSYEKSRAEQKNLFFFLPRQSNFAVVGCKVTKKQPKGKGKTVFLSSTMAWGGVGLSDKQEPVCKAKQLSGARPYLLIEELPHT